MDFDNVLREIGGWGPYQKKRVTLILLLSFWIASSGHYMPAVTLIAPEFFCSDDQNTTAHSSDNSTASSLHLCAKHEQFLSEQTADFTPAHHQCSQTGEWMYKGMIGDNVVTEYHLVCGRKFYVSIAVALYTAGDLIGTLIMQILIDRIGRKRTLFLGVFIHIVFGFASILIKNVHFFLVCKFVTSLFTSYCYMSGFVLALEFVSPAERTTAATISQVIWSLTTVAISLIAALLTNWVYLGLVTYSWPVLLAIVAYWVVPESPRWLLNQPNRLSELKRILRQIAVENKKSVSSALDEKAVNHLLEENGFLSMELITKDYSNEAVDNESMNDNKSHLRHIFENRILRNRLFVLTVLNVIVIFVYNSVPYIAANLPGNLYVIFCLYGLVELPAILINWLLITRCGALRMIASFSFISGIACILTIFLDKIPSNGVNWYVISSALLGKMVLIVVATLTIQTSSENFHTNARGSAVGFCNFIARIIFLALPLLRLTADINQYLPHIIIGFAGCFGGFLVLFLPDTNGKDLPDNVNDAQALGSVGFKAFRNNICCKPVMLSKGDRKASGKQLIKQ